MIPRNIMEIWPYCTHQVCTPIESIQFCGKTGRIHSSMIFSLYALCCQHLLLISHLPILSGHACIKLTSHPKGTPKEAAAFYQFTDSRYRWSTQPNAQPLAPLKVNSSTLYLSCERKKGVKLAEKRQRPDPSPGYLFMSSPNLCQGY